MLTLNAVRTGSQNRLFEDQISGSHAQEAMHYVLARNRTEHELRQNEERYALALAGDGLWDWDRWAGRIYYSPRWKSLLGYGEAEIGDQPWEWLERTHPDDRRRLEQHLERHWQGLTPRLHVEHRLQHKDGSYRWLLCRGQADHGHGRGARRMAGLLTDIHEAKQREAQLEHDALHDPLTGLANRSLLLDRLRRALDQMQRTPERRFAVLFIDLDRFKKINDRFGHLAGDTLLVECARRLSGFSRPADTLARLGGDEFILLLEGIAGPDDALRVVRRIEARFAEPVAVGDHQLVLSASIGIVIGTSGHSHPEDLLHDADAAMYSAKARGRACSSLFEDSRADGDDGVARQMAAVWADRTGPQIGACSLRP